MTGNAEMMVLTIPDFYGRLFTGNNLKRIIPLTLSLFIIFLPDLRVKGQDAQAIVDAGFNYIRDKASVSLVEMTIHRPDWQRVFTIKALTLGEKESLFTIISPPKDNGNGTLKKGREMWIYNPKINRVISRLTLLS